MRGSACVCIRSRWTGRGPTRTWPPPRERRLPPTVWAASRCSVFSTRSSPEPAFRSIIPVISRSFRRLPPRRQYCSTSLSGRRRYMRAAGWRAPVRSTRRTRHCAGCPIWPVSRPGRVVSSSRGGRSATFPPWSQPGTRRNRPGGRRQAAGPNPPPGGSSAVPKRTPRLRPPPASWASTFWSWRRTRTDGSPVLRWAPRWTPPASPWPTRSSPSWQQPVPRSSALSMIFAALLTWPVNAVSGYTSTAPTDWPHWLRNQSVTFLPVWRTQTPSSLIRTNGCSRRSTPAR